MSEYETSGQTQRTFCREHGLALSTFARWRRLLAQEPAPEAGEPQRLFTELERSAPGEALAETPAWEVELALGAGVVLRIRRGEAC